MLTHPNFSPLIFSVGPFQLFGKTIGPIGIHWYGLMYLLAFVTAWFIAVKRSEDKNSPIRKAQVEDLVVYGAIGVVVGGRIGYALFYHFDYLMKDFLWLFRIWEGGMSFHGGFIGVVVMMVWFAHRQKISLVALLDFIAPAIPPGLGFGRIGNFINQELWGRRTDLPWGMLFPNDKAQVARHPSQLYEAFFEGLVLFVIIYWFSKKPRPTGAVCGVGIFFYGVFRTAIEFTREPDSHIQFDLFGWVTRGQLLSLPMIIGGLIIVIWAYKNPRSLLGRYN